MYLTILVLLAMERRETLMLEDPSWARQKLPSERENVPGRDYCVLYQNNGGKHKLDTLFGILFLRGGKRVLSIPSDQTDWSAPWDDYCFVDYANAMETTVSSTTII